MRGRLWRASDPQLDPALREAQVKALMTACRDVGAATRAGDVEAEKNARARVHAAKVALGERGPVWWTDGAPDYNRHLIRNTPYADATARPATTAASTDALRRAPKGGML